MCIVSFDDSTMNTLKSVIGKTLHRYSCDPFVFTNTVFGIVGFKIGEKYYKLSAELETVQRFFAEDDVAVLRFQECTAEEIVSRMDNGKLIDTPVTDSIIRVDVINDHETVSHGAESRELVSTKGIIIHLSSGNEVSFEMGSWFSEMITVRRGYNLIDQFTPVSDFVDDEWSNCDGYVGSCTREIIELSDSK